MGVLQLSDFREELDLIFGDRSFTNENTFYDRWTNFGYLEVTTAIDFEELDAEFSITTADGGEDYDGPSDPLAIKMIRDETNDRNLDWVEKQELFRQPKTSTGEPEVWTRHITEIFLRPVPDDIYTLTGIYKKTPDLLSSASDTTVLQAAWDQGIIYFAISHGFMVLGEEDRGIAWYNRGLAFAQSRMTEGKFSEGTVGLRQSQADLDPGENLGVPNA